MGLCQLFVGGHGDNKRSLKDGFTMHAGYEGPFENIPSVVFQKRKQLPAEESSDEKLSSVVSKQELPESPTSEKEIDIETPPPTPPRTPSPEPSPEPVNIPKPISPPKPIQKFVSRIPMQRLVCFATPM